MLIIGGVSVGDVYVSESRLGCTMVHLWRSDITFGSTSVIGLIR